MSARIALASLLALATAAHAAAIRVANHADGTTIRYPVPLLRGTVEGADAITVVNTSSKRSTREMAGLVHKGQFKALTELVPGENKLRLRAGEAELPLTLHYKPQTNPYVVRVIYFTDRSGNTEYQTPIQDDAQDFRGKLDTAMKLLQTFTAERLHDLGLGRATFNLELDANGRVKVHVLQGDLPVERYHAMNGLELYSHIGGQIARKLPHPRSRNLVIPAFTRFDPKTGKVYAHTALGGGNLALFGGGNLFAWPTSLGEVQRTFTDATRVDPRQFFSDSVGRHTFWAIASTTLGAALHELGHTFGLPHSEDPHDIMTRGIDRLNRFFTFADPPHAGRREPYEFPDDEVAWWAPVSAAALVPNRFFALDDRTWNDDSLTEFRLDTASRRVLVDSEHGIRYVGVYRYGPQIGIAAVYHIPLDDRDGAPKHVAIPVAELGRRLATTDVALHVLDAQGNTSGNSLPQLLNGPFVQAWRFASITAPWPDAKAFAPVDAAKLETIEKSAAAAKLARSHMPFVDFLRLAPGERQTNVAGYALRILRTDAPRKVKLLTGSDDALRVWLNGRLVTQALQLRGATPDQEATVVDLAKGENRLLAEVSNAGGGWGLILRLEDPDGARLDLKDDGTLATVDGRAAEQIRALLRGPFVRRWRFAAVTCPWNDHGAFVALDADKLKAIEASAAAADPVEGDPNVAYVDFLPRFPRDKQANVAAYALRTLRSDKPRTVKLFTGSDDALRIWLNGQLITQVLQLRGVARDAESTEARLRAGDNRLLVEVSNAGGGWGLALRIEDADGADLLLAADGHLLRAQP